MPVRTASLRPRHFYRFVDRYSLLLRQCHMFKEQPSVKVEDASFYVSLQDKSFYVVKRGKSLRREEAIEYLIIVEDVFGWIKLHVDGEFDEILGSEDDPKEK